MSHWFPAKDLLHMQAMRQAETPTYDSIHKFMVQFTGEPAASQKLHTNYSAVDYAIVLSALLPRKIDLNRFCWVDTPILTQVKENWHTFVGIAATITELKYPPLATVSALCNDGTPEYISAHLDVQMWLFRLAQKIGGGEQLFCPFIVRTTFAGSAMRSCKTTQRHIQKALLCETPAVGPIPINDRAKSQSKRLEFGNSRKLAVSKPMPDDIFEVLREIQQIKRAMREVEATMFRQLADTAVVNSQALATVADIHYPLDVQE